MQRKSNQELRDLFLNALSNSNWNDVAIWSTELLKRDENQAFVWSSRGIAYAQMGFPVDAILNYDRALALEELAVGHSNKGSAYWDMENATKSLESLRRAIEIQPLAPTYMTMGNIHKHRGDLKEAIACYRTGAIIDPDYADIRMQLGMTLLKSGQLEEGWKEYEWRWKSNQLPARKLKCPQWRGENLDGKIILVYGEQGLGDIIQFSRYVRILSNAYPKAKIIIEGRPVLKRLLETIPEAYSVINIGERLPELDFAIPMISLAARFTPTIESIPCLAQEFFLDKNDTDHWHAKFEELPKGFKIGLCWAGMSRTAHPAAAAVDTLRSTSLASFAGPAKLQGAVWVSLQKGPPAEQIKTPPSGMTIGDFGEDMYDFYETCCAIKNCDLVITVDTAVAHAAASVGVPTWMLSRWDGCWRWFGNRPDSPWYPTLRQFVQPAPHDWDGMMVEVAGSLSRLLKDKDKLGSNLTLAKLYELGYLPSGNNKS